MRERVDELRRFIERLTERFKETDTLFATRLEVTDRELALLRALVADGPMITKALGGRFGVPVSTMTGLVDRMEQRGLVRRVPGRRDRRSIELEATPAGALALREHGRRIEALARGMLEALPERDQKTLITILRRVLGRIEGATTEPTKRRATR
ncbi:MAG TPA: MarR family winged helix-turn-helix transcriptional regulator [Candidatus Binatia bacterium]|nr:MarR family winged helix-turn-helix transcriptional regulator [Candidatus Binatia bacterium]